MAVGSKTLLFRGSFSHGIVRDTARHAIPAGGVFDAQDYLLERPGVAYKRGGWERHSNQLGTDTSVAAVATIHIPTRVVAVNDSGTLYDVTTGATSIGSCFTPGENPPMYGDGKLIFCDPAASGVPDTVYWDPSGGGAIVIGTLFGGTGVLPAAHSIVHNDYVVLGRGDNSDADNPLNRVWIPPDPVLSPLVDPLNAFFPVTREVSGFASCSGVLLVFSPISIERVLGSIPPGYGTDAQTANWELQPLAGVGCLDARSIVHLDESVIFAGQEGVWLTNGAAVKSLTERPDGTGIQSYWRSLFSPGVIRQVIGGLLDRDFYIVNILDDVNAPVDCLVCHLPSQTWTRLKNVSARMFAQGRDEQENLELYAAAATEGYVNAMTSMLRPDWAHRADGDGTPVLPLLEVPFGDSGLLKEFQQGRVTHALTTEVVAVWAAATVYAVGAQIVADEQVFQVTARTGDFKSGLIVPDWASVTTVGGTAVDNHVTWTNEGPEMVVSTAAGLNPTAFTVATTFPLTDGRRAWYELLLDNQQTVTVRLEQSGGSATTEVHGLEVDVRTYESGVSGGE